MSNGHLSFYISTVYSRRHEIHRDGVTNPNQVLAPPQTAQGGGLQTAYKTSQNLSESKCFICGEIGHCASIHRDPEVQQPRASGALFSKEASGPEDTVQAKLIMMVEEDDEDAMQAALVTLRDGGAKKRQIKSKSLRPLEMKKRRTSQLITLLQTLHPSRVRSQRKYPKMMMGDP